MKYYTQKTYTDCLLAAAENLVQKPRRKFGKLTWFNKRGHKYLRYKSLAKILIKYNKGGQLITKGDVDLDERPAIIGIIYTLNGSTICHSLFWDGEKAFCPSRKEFIPLDELDVLYIVTHPKYNGGPNSRHLSYKNLKEICTNWDSICFLNSEKKEKILDSQVVMGPDLITIFHKDKIYKGSLQRVFTNRIYNYEKK